MIVTAREFTSSVEMRAAAAALHASFFKPAKRPAPKQAPVKVHSELTAVVTSPRERPPLWRCEETAFDAHASQYRARLVETAMNPARVHIKDRCRELGVPFEVMIGSDRRKKTAQLRHVLMWEIHQLFGLSFPAIGRLFGGRDHTTCLYAIRKIETQRGEA